MDVIRLGERLRHLRELRGMSITALAAAAGIAKSYLAKLERGEVDNPGLKTLQALATALDATLSDLLTLDADRVAGEPTSEIGDYEVILRSLPPGLQEFLRSKESAGDRLPADVVKSLASIQFRGKRPETADDWAFLYQAINRSM